MRLQIVKSKNSQSFYVVKTVYINKKRTNKVVEKLGTYKILKEKSAEEIALLTCIIGIISSGLWLWYGIMNDHISMIVTNAISVTATGILLILKWKYSGNA